MSRQPTPRASSSHEWPYNFACFDPDLDDEDDVAGAFKEIETGQLAKSTSLYVLLGSAQWTNAQETTLSENQAMSWLCSRGQAPTGFELCAISRLNPNAQSPATSTDRGRLQVSQQVFRSLMSTYQVPVAFLAALSRPYQVCGTGFRRISSHSWDYWCLIPVRTLTTCHIQAKDHTKSRAGSNQMDPFHYIHLSGTKTDIRGSQIGLWVRHDDKTGGTSVVVVNLLDSRLRSLIEEPLTRARGAIKRRSGTNSPRSRWSIHLIYLSSALRWWNNVLFCFNQQLVMHEKQLQLEIATQSSAFSDASKDINTALHIMAAHLHRYKSELHRVEFILSEIRSPKFSPSGTNSAMSTEDGERESLKSEQLMSQLNAIISFADEMERKIQNVLTLLFNQIQVTNDNTLQAILKTAQADTKLSQKVAFQSHQLTISMKNDSVAMKTIAIVTMLFLPAASFAAVFSMPFFTETDYLTAPSHIWIWVILTVTFTAIAFGVYGHVISRQKETFDDNESDSEVGVTSTKDLQQQTQQPGVKVQ
ncbi:hypothetical protein AK830_g984 [Neonectria ditissima]|uniref:Uncharacterized protein n=1 Tax=Neonectria ditissima TaxID=78410 RepID=A0A0P7BK25_9HYPO|nr:hypothetical protein AK830_g984 [Neonectria ditissima]